MSKAQREKGARGELQIVHILKDAGYDVARTPNSGGLTWKGDIQGLPGFHLEVKYQETTHISQWCKQAEDDAEEGQVPLLIFRRSYEPWRVCLTLDRFLELLER